MQEQHRHKEALALTQALIAGAGPGGYHGRSPRHGNGNTLTTSGDSAARLDAVRQGLRAAESALALNPADERATFTLIAAYDAFGTALIPTRDLPAVLHNYRRGLAAAEQLAARVPDVRVRQALARAHENVGEVLSQMGDLIPAVDHARQSVKLLEALVIECPNESTHRRNLMSAHTGLGDLLGSPVEFSLGQPAAAEAEYRKALAIGDGLAAADEKDAQAQLTVATLSRKLGNVLATSNLRSSVEMHRRAVAVMERLLSSGPKNMTYRRQQALNYLWFAQPLHALRHDVAAFASVRRALAMQRDILIEDSTRQNIRQDMLATHNALGDLQLDSGNAEGALGSYREALAIAESVATAAPADEWARRDRIDCYERLGQYWARDASRAGVTAARRLEAWRKAREWHQKSLSDWNSWIRLSNSNVYVQRRHDQAAKAVAASDAALATIGQLLEHQ
jgi:tetratricopeptide (TPR) repeat protein